MSNNAWDFVVKMQKDKQFRSAVCNAGSEEKLRKMLEEQGFTFGFDKLIGAMAKCMESIEKCCERS